MFWSPDTAEESTWGYSEPQGNREASITDHLGLPAPPGFDPDLDPPLLMEESD